MPTIGVADILVVPVFKDLQKQVGRELDDAASKSGRSAGSKMGDALGGALKAGALAVGGAAVAGLGVALTKGFGRLQAIENAKAKLTGLGHDVESVTSIMNNAMAAVKGTAFGLDEAATVAAGAVAAGIKPGAELERTLRLTGDAATIAGVGMSDMGAIFNGVATSNKIQGDTIAQLNDAGIPIVQLMAKELGKTAEETVNLASEGKINFETFQNAMEAGLGGAALESGKTLQGAFKNTMAAVGRIGASLLSGVYPKIQQFFSGAIEWLKPLEAGAKIAGAAIGVFLDKAITGAQGLYDLIVKGDYTGKLREAFGWEEDSPFVDFLLKAKAGAEGLYDLIVKGDYKGKLFDAFGWEEDSPLVGFLLGVRDAIIGIASGISMDAATRDQFSGQLEGWVKAGAGIREAFEKSISILGDVIKKIWEFREPIGIVVGLIILSLIPHWVALGVEAMKSAVQQKIAWGITKSEAIGAAFSHSWAVTVMVGGWILMAAQATINAVRIAAAWLIALGPVGWIILAVAAIGAAIWAAYENIGWFKDGVDAAMRWVSEAVTNAFKWIQDAIGVVVSWFTDTALPAWDNAIKAVGGFFSWLWTDIIKPVFDWISAAAHVVGDAFTWLFTDGVKYATDGIGSALNWLYETIIKPVFDGISVAVNAVGAVFNWLWLNILKPVFDSASVIIGGFYMFFRGVGQLIVSLVTYILIPLFMVFWNSMVDTFTAIGNVISDWWNGAVTVFNNAVSFIRDVFSAAFTWLHDSVIKPVFDAIGTAISWVWDNVIKPTFDAWVYLFQVTLPAVFTWLYDNVIKPVFDGIGNAINWVWTNVIKPVFDNWVYFFQTVIPDALNWLYLNVVKPVFDGIGNAIKWVWDNVIKPVFDSLVWVLNNVIQPAFDGIGNAIKWVWENVIKPVFDTLSDFITKTIPDAFDKGVGFIKTAWDKLIEIAKMPVKFVIDTVINDGLIGAFNTVAGILPGIDKLPRVALPDGFARGGILPGQSSWRNGDDQLVPMRQGEGVLVSEVMRDPYERARLYAMNKAAIMGRKASEVRALFGEGFAKGGIVNPLTQMIETQGYNRIHKGVDFAASVGTPVFATENGRVSWSGPGVQAPGVWGGNEVHVDGGSGIQSWFAHLSSMAVKVGDMVRAGQQIALSGNTGITSGPHLHFGTFAGGWPNDINPYSYLGGAGVPSGGGFNPLAGILDGLLSKFKEAFPAAGMIADLAIGVGKKLFGSITDLITGGKGSATGDPALYDMGGILPPGISQVVNRTGKPEAILNPQQWADISRLAAQGGGRGDTNFYGNVGWDPHEVADRIETKRRDTFAAFGI